LEEQQESQDDVSGGPATLPDARISEVHRVVDDVIDIIKDKI
jgi:hypothetical protein